MAQQISTSIDTSEPNGDTNLTFWGIRNLYGNQDENHSSSMTHPYQRDIRYRGVYGFRFRGGGPEIKVPLDPGSGRKNGVRVKIGVPGPPKMVLLEFFLKLKVASKN